jgi:exodeoxyribonuclease VII large subunit
MLAESFGDIWATGEVSNLKSYPSGHRYFVLKDEASQIDAAVFRSVGTRLGFELEDGLQIVGHGHLDLYEPRGKYQLILDRLEPVGLGALQKAFEQLKKKLAAEGLFAESRKRPLPLLPRVVGIVTSPSGAAIHDMLRTFRLHRARMRVLVHPAQVQGDGAGEQVAQGIRALSDHGDVQVIIVGRGGGSVEDLWCFNEEVVARAIAASRVPVVSGVGHEVDYTIADFVADFRAATPTAAAAMVARGWEQLEDRFGELMRRLIEAIEQELLDREHRLEEFARHRAFDVVRGRLAEARHRVERAATGAGAAAGVSVRVRLATFNQRRERLAAQGPLVRLERVRRRLEQSAGGVARRAELAVRERGARFRESAARLAALSPLAILARGYSVLRSAGGAVISRADQVAGGDRIEALVSDGRLECEVLATQRGVPADGG